MSNTLMDSIKKKFDTTREFQAQPDQSLLYPSPIGQKRLYAPVPIRNNANIFNSNQITPIGNSITESRLIETLLTKISAENLPTLNSVSSILN
jgi:hypothetical protein